jgi:hypothetical protein
VDEQEQLEIWWQSLEPDARRSLIETDDHEPPGWAVASAVASHVELKQDPRVDDAVDTQARIATLLAEFLEAKRQGEGQ